MPRTPAAAEPNATTEPEKRKVPHRAQLEHLPNLPKPWTKATDRIGAVDHTPAGPDGRAARGRPLQPIVCCGPKDDIFSHITEDTTADAAKTIKYGNKYTVSQKLRAAEYSRLHGYDRDGAVARPPPATRFAVTPPAPAPAGQPDYQAVVRDALNGKFMPRDDAYKLALAYERVIAEMKKDAPRARRRLPSASTSHKRKQPSGAAEPTGDAETAARAQSRGRAAGIQQTEVQRRVAATRARERSEAKENRAMEKCSATIGGAHRLTPFIVALFRRSVKKTGAHKKNCFLKENAVDQLLDEPDVYPVIRKKIDLLRKPKISQFMVAHLTGVTYSAMDKMRFAMHWCPGHSTMARHIKALEHRIETAWCPSGPIACHGTTRTAAQQAEDAAEAAQAGANAEGEEDNVPGAPTLGDEELATLDAEARAAVDAELPQDAHDVAEIAAEDRQKQCLALLEREYPADTEEKRWDRWAGGMDYDKGVFVGANIIVVQAVQADKVIGFVKALRTRFELFVDEVLVAAEARGPQGINTHMFYKLATTVAGRQRLQVNESNAKAIKSYRRLGFTTWTPGASGSFAEEQPEDSCMFMQAPRATVLSNCKQFCERTALPEGIQLLICAAMPIAGVDFHYVGKPVESAHGADVQGAQQDGAGQGEELEEEHVAEQPEVVTDPNCDAGGDDATHAAADSGEGKVATSWGATSLNSALSTMFNGTQSTPRAPVPYRPHLTRPTRVLSGSAQRGRSASRRQPADQAVHQDHLRRGQPQQCAQEEPHRDHRDHAAAQLRGRPGRERRASPQQHGQVHGLLPAILQTGSRAASVVRQGRQPERALRPYPLPRLPVPLSHLP